MQGGGNTGRDAMVIWEEGGLQTLMIDVESTLCVPSKYPNGWETPPHGSISDLYGQMWIGHAFFLI